MSINIETTSPAFTGNSYFSSGSQCRVKEIKVPPAFFLAFPRILVYVMRCNPKEDVHFVFIILSLLRHFDEEKDAFWSGKHVFPMTVHLLNLFPIYLFSTIHLFVGLTVYFISSSTSSRHSFQAHFEKSGAFCVLPLTISLHSLTEFPLTARTLKVCSVSGISPVFVNELSENNWDILSSTSI